MDESEEGDMIDRQTTPVSKTGLAQGAVAVQEPTSRLC